MYFCQCLFRSTSIKGSLRPNYTWTRIFTSRSIWAGSRARLVFPGFTSTVFSRVFINGHRIAILPKKGSNRLANGSQTKNSPSPRSAIMSVSRASGPSACYSKRRLASHPGFIAMRRASEKRWPYGNPNPLSQIVLSIPPAGIDDRPIDDRPGKKSNIREHAAATIH